MRHLLLFGKCPRPGRVKTRLVPPLTEVQAEMLYRAFLSDQLEFLRGFAGSCPVWYADRDLEAGDRALPLAGIDVRQQGSGDLGLRLERAFLQTGRMTVVIAADSPTLPRAHVERAFETLEAGGEAVLSEAADGGYVLLGLDRPRPELLHGIPWGGSSVSRVTKDRAATAGIRLTEIDPWYDVDDLAGLRRLRQEMEAPAVRERAPATALALLDLPLEGVL